MNTDIRTLTNGRLELLLREVNQHLRLEQLAAQGITWLIAGGHSPIFRVWVDGQAWDAANLTFNQAKMDELEAGVQHVTLSFLGPVISVEQHIKMYAESALIESWPIIRNTAGVPCTIERIDSIALNIDCASAELFSFTGNWGSEYEPHRTLLQGDPVILESRSGRSSKGNHPWFSLFRDQQVFSGAVAWSGNWVFRFEPLDRGYCLSGGLHDWEFFKTLQPGESMDAPAVTLACGSSLNDVSQQYTRVGRKYWYPRSEFASTLPVEWNHWWPYEDAEINETVFARNVTCAGQMGFEVCTLDAGWFGPADAGTFWENYRGDWHIVNTARFPSGLRQLADQVHAHGMRFGIWCEIEGLGKLAQVAIDHPEYVALRDNQRIGCMCFGNPAVQEWAYQTLARLITEVGADWIKLDYNLDQGAGCNRIDHGHQAGDGQYMHYMGYYRTLARIRRDFPQVVLENCSSGGLRIDLAMLRHTDMTFLSDPDWPDHDLQIFWGASTMLAPDRLLHWTYSHWRNLNPPDYQRFNPHDPNLTRAKWDYYTRISMLGLYGISQRLPDLPAWLAQRIAEHNRIYQQQVRRFIKEADLYRLTDQPRRDGQGDRWAAFQYSLPDGSEHLLFVFRLPGGEPVRSVRLEDLELNRLYMVTGLEGEFSQQMTGRELMETGLIFTNLGEEESALLRLS